MTSKKVVPKRLTTLLQIVSDFCLRFIESFTPQISEGGLCFCYRIPSTEIIYYNQTSLFSLKMIIFMLFGKILAQYITKRCKFKDNVCKFYFVKIFIRVTFFIDKVAICRLSSSKMGDLFGHPNTDSQTELFGAASGSLTLHTLPLT